MKRDEIANGEALSDEPGESVVDINGMMALRMRADIDPAAAGALKEIENRAFRLYQRAFAENEKAPTVQNAAALVRSYNAYADIMGMERA